MRLTPRQRLILGPPGCGKTTALLRYLEYALEQNIAPERVAYFSFTRKAVEVARTRAMERFDLTRHELPYFRTLHSMTFALNGYTKHDVLGLEHYREIGQLLGIQFSNVRIDDSTGLPQQRAEGDLHLFVDALARARQVPLQEQWEEIVGQDLDFRAIERTIATIRAYKRKHGLVDYTDMLENYIEYGRPLDVDIAFIDEAQDLSRLQWDVLRHMLSKCPETYIAGDDDQSIFAWSGADVDTFLNLEGQQDVLDKSWRCAQAINKIAAHIASRISRRFDKPWHAREEQGSIDQVHSIDAFDFSNLSGTTLLLARNSYLLPTYTRELRKQGYPYLLPNHQHSVRVDHAKAIYAYTKLQRGEHISGAEVKTITDQLRAGVGIERGRKDEIAQLDNRESFTSDELREQYGITAHGPWYDALDAIAVRDREYYRSILRSKRSLVDEPTIAVNTIHSVKGGEADNVMVCPDMAARSYNEYASRNADHEHRVAYVAVSRARTQLYILSPRTQNFYPYN